MLNTKIVSATGNPEIDGLLSGFAWDSSAITYSFPNSASTYPSNISETTSGFSQLSIIEQSLVVSIFKEISQFTDLTFYFNGTGSADIMLAHTNLAVPAYAYYPDGTMQSGEVWFGVGTSTGYLRLTVPLLGDYSTLVHIHEIGHALGLKHASDIGGPANEMLPRNHDNLEYSVMSYISIPYSTPGLGLLNEQYGYPTTYMMNDILALQYLYGANYSGAGNDVYSWDPSTGQEFINGIGQGTPGANRVFMTIWDGAGHATYDFSNYTTDQNININPGAYSIISTAQLAKLSGGKYPFLADGNVFNAYLFDNDPRSYIANVKLGSGNDIVFGNPVDNIFTFGSGHDIYDFNGNIGHDTIIGFNVSLDTIQIDRITGITDFASILNHISEVGSDTVINFGTNDVLTLKGVNDTTLTAQDFTFASPSPDTIRDFVYLDGIQTAIVNDTIKDVTINNVDSTITITSPITITNPLGLNEITDASRIEFNDGVLAFDINGTAGFEYRLYQAAFNRTPDETGLSFNVHLLDSNAINETQMAAAFVASPEFVQKYGSLTNDQFVIQLYNNVLHRAPDAAGEAGWVHILNTNQETKGQVLIGFSESTENHNNIDPSLTVGIVLDPQFMLHA